MKREDLLANASADTQKLYNELQQLHKDLARSFAMHLNRSLPLPELLTDRWQRAKALSFGEGTSVYDSVLVFGDVNVGKNTWIGPFVILDGSGRLQIGSHCSISAGVQIYSHNTVLWAVSGGKEQYQYKPTTIGDNCFIGPMSIIQNGVTIGNHCVVAANSFVNKDVLPYTIVGGTPSKIIGHVVVSEEGIRLEYSDEK
jgi:acetyltransferase-like isoleucine patch superfamily enzyme